MNLHPGRVRNFAFKIRFFHVTVKRRPAGGGFVILFRSPVQLIADLHRSHAVRTESRQIGSPLRIETVRTVPPDTRISGVIAFHFMVGDS